MRRVKTLHGRTTVILGAPFYTGRFPREFHRFLARHRDALTPLRPWCFVLGPAQNETADIEATRSQAARQLEQYPWLIPTDLKVLGAKFDVKLLPFPFRIFRSLRLSQISKNLDTEIRDWVAIRDWADGIAHQIKPAA